MYINKNYVESNAWGIILIHVITGKDISETDFFIFSTYEKFYLSEKTKRISFWKENFHDIWFTIP